MRTYCKPKKKKNRNNITNNISSIPIVNFLNKKSHHLPPVQSKNKTVLIIFYHIALRLRLYQESKTLVQPEHFNNYVYLIHKCQPK